MDRARHRIRFEAMTVAMLALTFRLEPEQVRALDRHAAAELDCEDPLQRAILSFVEAWERERRAPEAVAKLGDALRHAVELDLWTPPDAHRVDIHG